MKKFLKIISVIVAIIIVYCVIAMLFFDSKCHNEQSLVINAPKEKVWQNVNSMKAFNTWNPWMKMDPNLTVTYQGNSGEVGDGYHWKGNDDVGEGEQEITAIIRLRICFLLVKVPEPKLPGQLIMKLKHFSNQ